MELDKLRRIREILLKRIDHCNDDYSTSSQNGLMAISQGVQALLQVEKEIDKAIRLEEEAADDLYVE